MPKKKGGERGKTASALGRKMDVQTLHQKERIQTVGAVFVDLVWDDLGVG